MDCTKSVLSQTFPGLHSDGALLLRQVKSRHFIDVFSTVNDIGEQKPCLSVSRDFSNRGNIMYLNQYEG